MVVNFTKDILESEKQKQDISYLIQTIAWHRHIITFDPNIAQLPHWIESKDRELLEESFVASIIGNRPRPHCDVVTDAYASTVTTAKIFSVREAIEYVSAPLTIILEHSNNDSLMILKMLESYTKDAAHAYYDKRLEFGHAGGCSSIKSVISEKLRQNGERSKMLRYFVIVDGDKRFHGQVITKYDNLKTFLQIHNIPYHILEKRCMENYLPCEAFPYATNKEHSKWINAFKALTPQQRDFFNISGGLKGELPEETKKMLKSDYSNIRTLISLDLQHFYSTVSDTNLRILTEGYTIKSFKEEFPKGFNNPSVTRESLDKIQSHQDDPTELKQVAEQINRLL